MTVQVTGKQHIVILTTYFPPVVSVASQRMAAFARYLDKDLFDITVVALRDKKTGDHPFAGVTVIRLTNPTLFRYFSFSGREPYLVHKLKALMNRLTGILIHDPFKGWRKKATDELARLDRQKKIDILISSYAPEAPHRAALELKQKGFSFRWIADFRDEMSFNPYYGRRKRKKSEILEREIFRSAWCLTTVTTSLAGQYSALCKTYLLPVLEIRNGFDFELSTDYTYNPVFTLSHTGTLYADRKPYRFFEALEEIMAGDPAFRCRILLTGAGKAVDIPSSLSGIVTSTGKISHEDAIAAIRNSDANLFILPPSTLHAVPVKLYEYLAAGKPVIALADPDCEAAGIIRNSRSGFVAGFEDIDGIRSAIIATHALWKNRQRPEVDTEYIMQFQRIRQVKKLESYILKNLP